jgi:DNA-directed RNA polymerase specialized sigma24 family protein
MLNTMHRTARSVSAFAGRRIGISSSNVATIVQPVFAGQTYEAETFLRAARSPDAVPIGAGDKEAWLVRVLVNIRRDQWRHAAVRQRCNRDRNSDSREIASAEPDPEEAIIARTTIWKALDLLPPRRRAAIETLPAKLQSR